MTLVGYCQKKTVSFLYIEILKLKIVTMPILRGALIVLEGCDRSGKTTQCKDLGKQKEIFAIARS